MKLPEIAVDEFKKIYQKKFGTVLDCKLAEIKAINFITLTFLLIEGSDKNNHSTLPIIKTKNE